MSSVTRFLKQFDVSQSYLSVPSSLTSLYEFVPSGTVTGNYPAGTVRAVTGDAETAIVRQSAVSPNLILRDMGKTITAGTTAAPTVIGRYRQVQLLAARDLNAANNTFGVVGEAAYNYFTLYIPVPVGGVLGAAPLAVIAPLAGGQM